MSTSAEDTPRYQSIDALQGRLARDVFGDRDSAKKAAGRALGTFVELITFYLIRDWGLEEGLAIERGLPEYGNAQITHNVEFSLHPAAISQEVTALRPDKTLTATALMASCKSAGLNLGEVELRSTELLRNGVLRHAAVFATGPDWFWTARMVGAQEKFFATKLSNRPYAMFECKRVGIEEGMKKGPQTIEKAKQGAYVARTVSGLQRVPLRNGSVAAVVEQSDGKVEIFSDYYGFLRDAIDRADVKSLDNVVLTVGVVSNHGNWFTAETQNKEMKVLAQSYDWLLFLTDEGLAEFIEDVLWGSREDMTATRKAVLEKFKGGGSKSFTKVALSAEADAELTRYFRDEQPWDRWFNVIAPAPSKTDDATDPNPGGEPRATEEELVVEAVSLGELKRDLERMREIHRLGVRS